MGARHIALVGDSIFDNDGYVPGEPGVIAQMRQSLPSGWSCHKLAVDGDCIADVAAQLRSLPTHITDIVISVGGNDARQSSHLLSRVTSEAGLAEIIRKPLKRFHRAYAQMVSHVETWERDLLLCTIYRDIPFEDPVWQRFAPLAIDHFNHVILEVAKQSAVPVLRLDRVCTTAQDFSDMSPIEPSAQGGRKIVAAILNEVALRA